MSINIRLARAGDARSLLAIYAPYVLHTAVTFEYETPSAEEFAERIAHTLERYPYLVAEEHGAPAGYAYASAFKSRAAYAWSAETSIYVDRDRQGRGIGTLLYKALEECLAAQNICNLCACIAYPNPPSISFHEGFGYRTAAHFTASGYKDGCWYDMVWMEKELNPHRTPPKPFLPFHMTEIAGRYACRTGKDSL